MNPTQTIPEADGPPEVQPPADKPSRRGKPPTAKVSKRERRDYAGELASLQTRVTLAIRLLRNVVEVNDDDSDSPLTKMAIELLTEA